MDWPMIQRPMRKKLSWIITYIHIDLYVLIIMSFQNLIILFDLHSCQDELTVERCWYGCPNDWTLFRESCYYFNRNKKHGSFLDAKAECEDLGGYLVEIESKEEDDFIIDTVSCILRFKQEIFRDSYLYDIRGTHINMVLTHTQNVGDRNGKLKL